MFRQAMATYPEIPTGTQIDIVKLETTEQWMAHTHPALQAENPLAQERIRRIEAELQKSFELK
jgi:hypothetical protein